jgi:tetratricopeptide (TPR) repeat protein
MNDDAYQVAHLSDIPATETDGRIRYRVREYLDVGAFGVNVFRATAVGDRIIQEHSEAEGDADEHEELYLVVAGAARFTLNGEQHDANQGTFVFVRDPQITRAAVATEKDTTVLAVGGRRGQAYRVAPWEFSSRGIRCLNAEDWEGARAALEEGLALYPEDDALHYNMACLEARTGGRENALGHLLRAIELDPETAEWAQDDDDLDPIRDDERFPRPR